MPSWMCQTTEAILWELRLQQRAAEERVARLTIGRQSPKKGKRNGDH
jgi:hypothetical protein